MRDSFAVVRVLVVDPRAVQEIRVCHGRKDTEVAGHR